MDKQEAIQNKKRIRRERRQERNRVETVEQKVERPGTPELGGQEGRSPPLPFARRGKGGRSALWVLKYTWQILRKLFHMV